MPVQTWSMFEDGAKGVHGPGDHLATGGEERASLPARSLSTSRGRLMAGHGAHNPEIRVRIPAALPTEELVIGAEGATYEGAGFGRVPSWLAMAGIWVVVLGVWALVCLQAAAL